MTTNLTENYGRKRVVIYARVSTDDPRQAGSCSTQVKRCEQFLEAQGGDYEIVARLMEEGVSGKSMDRSLWNEVVRLLQDGEADLVLSTALDRMSRTLVGFLQFCENVLEPNRKSFATLHENIDTSTAAGRLVLNVLLVLAQFQREQTAERVAASRESKAKQGFHTTYPPFGTMPGDIPGIPIEDPERWPYLIKIFEWAAAGKGNAEICRELKRLNVRTVRGAFMDKTTIANLIGNQFFIGKVKHAGEWYPAKHACTVDKAVFRKAQRNRSKKRGRRTEGYIYLLQDLVHTSHFTVTKPDSEAGKPLPLRPRWGNGRSGQRYYYYLRADRMGRVGGLESEPADDLASEFPSSINAQELDAKVLDTLIGYTEAGQLDEVLGSTADIARERRDSVKAELTATRKRITRLESETEKLEARIVKLAASDSEESAFERSVLAINRRIDQASDELEQLTDTREALEAAAARLDNIEAEEAAVVEQFNILRQLRDAGDNAKLQTAIKALVHSVDVRMDEIRLRLYSIPGAPGAVLSKGRKIAPTGVEPVTPP